MKDNLTGTFGGSVAEEETKTVMLARDYLAAVAGPRDGLQQLTKEIAHNAELNMN